MEIDQKDSLHGHVLALYKENNNSTNQDDAYHCCHYMITKEKTLQNKWALIDVSIIEPNKTTTPFSQSYNLVLTEEIHHELLEKGKCSMSRYDDFYLELKTK